MAGGSSYRYTKRRRKKDDEGIAWLITIILTVIVVGIVALFKAIAWMIKLIISLFASINTKTKTKKTNNKSNYSNQNIQHKELPRPKYSPKKINSYIDNGPEVTYVEKTLRLPERVIETPYDDLFLSQIKFRGEEYFLDNKISNFKIENNKCTATISGTENYDVSIEFYKNKKIKKVSCTCPYYQKDEKYCKHLYALLLHYCNNTKPDGYVNVETYKEVKKKERRVNDNFYNRMLSICDSMQEIIDNTEEFYDSCEIEDDDITSMYEEIMEYKDKINTYGNTKIVDLNEALIEIAKDDLYELENLYDNLTLEYEEILSNAEVDELEDEDDEAFIVSAAYLLNEEEKRRRQEQEDYEAEREELRNTWGLMDHEIDEVQKGNYDPWQFEEEELEEDDYYYEDDR